MLGSGSGEVTKHDSHSNDLTSLEDSQYGKEDKREDRLEAHFACK